MIPVRTKDPLRAYSPWFGKPVVLLVVIRQCHVPVPCSIIGETITDVRVRIRPGWELNLPKELILAVEEDNMAQDSEAAESHTLPNTLIN